MNTQRNLLVISSISILLFTLLFISIKTDFQENYDDTQGKLNAIEKIYDIYGLNVTLKSMRGLNQMNEMDASYIKKMLLINENIIVSDIKKLDNKRLDDIYDELLLLSSESKVKSYKLYTKLLNHMDNMRFTLSDTSNLPFESDRNIYYLMSVGVFNIPDAIENIAKIRAIGSSNLSTGNKLSNKELFILDSNAKLFLDSIRDIKFVLSKVTYDGSHNLIILLDSILANFYTISNNLKNIEKENSSLTAKEYFLEVTKLINKTNNLHLAVKDSTNQLLEDRKDDAYIKIIFTISVYVIILCLISLSTFIIYYKNRLLIHLNNRKIIHNAIKDKLIIEYAKNLPLIDICNNSLNLIISHFKALNGSLYLYNKNNNKLYLASYYGIKSDNIPNTISLHDNTISENILEKKLKIIDINQEVNLGNLNINATTLINIPIIEFDDSFGTVQVLFEEKPESIEIDFLQELVSLMASYISKARKDAETFRYLELIDKNVLISKTDLSGNITEVSDYLCNLSQFTEEELIGQTHRVLRDPNTLKSLYTSIWKTITKDKIWNGEIKNRKKDGENYWIDTTIAPEYDMTGNKIGYTAIRTDITAKKKVEEISITDALTSLYNKRHFDTIFTQQININARGKDMYLVFVIMDIDFFKQYNDTYGHQEGDTTLKLVANALQVTMKRPDDYTFRLGGEEFGLLYHVDNKNDVLIVEEEARENVENLKIPHKGNAASKYVTISSGLYIIEPDDKIGCDEIYKKADKALYLAKENGRNRVHLAK